MLKITGLFELNIYISFVLFTKFPPFQKLSDILICYNCYLWPWLAVFSHFESSAIYKIYETLIGNLAILIDSAKEAQ